MSSDSLELEAEQFNTEREEQTTRLLKVIDNSSSMEARAEHQKTKHFHSLYSFTTSIGVGLIILVLFWILHFHGGFAWQTNPKQQFYWHPLLMVLGMVFLYSQSILVYRTFRNTTKITVKVVHALLHFLAFILSVIGLKAVFDSHNLSTPPTANLYTLHSWLGLLTVIIFSAQFLVGFLSFLYPGLSNSIRRAILPVHTAFGTGCFVLAIVATATGLMEKALFVLNDKYQDFPSEGVIFNIIGVFTALYGVLVLYLVNEEDYKRTGSNEDEIRLAG